MFRFYFQTGEFYSDPTNPWVTVLKDLVIPLLGVGVPLLLFYIGLGKEREKGEKSKREDLARVNRMENLRLLYFHSLLVEAIKNTVHFQKVVRGKQVDITLNRYKYENLALDDAVDAKRIVEDLDRESLYYAYLLHLDADSVSPIFKALDAVLGLRITFTQVWDKAIDEVTRFKNELNGIIENFPIILNDLETQTPNQFEIKDMLIVVFNNFAEVLEAGQVTRAERYTYSMSLLVNHFLVLLEKIDSHDVENWTKLRENVERAEKLDSKVNSVSEWCLKNFEEIQEILNRIVPNLFSRYETLATYLIENDLITEKVYFDDNKTDLPDIISVS